MKIKLELELDEVNAVLLQLTEGPFKTVEPLIREIQMQAAPQVNPAPVEAKKEGE